MQLLKCFIGDRANWIYAWRLLCVTMFHDGRTFNVHSTFHSILIYIYSSGLMFYIHAVQRKSASLFAQSIYLKFTTVLFNSQHTFQFRCRFFSTLTFSRWNATKNGFHWHVWRMMHSFIIIVRFKIYVAENAPRPHWTEWST